MPGQQFKPTNSVCLLFSHLWEKLWEDIPPYVDQKQTFLNMQANNFCNTSRKLLKSLEFAAEKKSLSASVMAFRKSLGNGVTVLCLFQPSILWSSLKECGLPATWAELKKISANESFCRAATVVVLAVAFEASSQVTFVFSIVCCGQFCFPVQLFFETPYRSCRSCRSGARD